MDGYLDGSTDGCAGRMEVIEIRTGRRVRSEAERARITLNPRRAELSCGREWVMGSEAAYQGGY